MNLKNKFHLKTLLIIFLFTAILNCSSKNQNDKEIRNIKFTFSNYKSGEVLSWPLPVKIRGKITNYAVDKENKRGLNIYLIEKSRKEKIWHIEPGGKVDKDGNWKAVTWLGNKRQGNRSRYDVCVFAVEVPLKLNNGNHPVKEKPENIGEECIELIRRDAE